MDIIHWFMNTFVGLIVTRAAAKLRMMTKAEYFAVLQKTSFTLCL